MKQKTENGIIEILNDNNLSDSSKAVLLGWKRKTINVEGKRVSAWVRGDEAYGSVKSVISWMKKYPMGYWYYQLRKEQILERGDVNNLLAYLLIMCGDKILSVDTSTTSLKATLRNCEETRLSECRIEDLKNKYVLKCDKLGVLKKEQRLFVGARKPYSLPWVMRTGSFSSGKGCSRQKHNSRLTARKDGPVRDVLGNTDK